MITIHGNEILLLYVALSPLYGDFIKSLQLIRCILVILALCYFNVYW